MVGRRFLILAALTLAVVCIHAEEKESSSATGGLRSEEDVSKLREEALSKLEKPLEKMRVKVEPRNRIQPRLLVPDPPLEANSVSNLHDQAITVPFRLGSAVRLAAAASSCNKAAVEAEQDVAAPSFSLERRPHSWLPLRESMPPRHLLCRTTFHNHSHSREIPPPKSLLLSLLLLLTRAPPSLLPPPPSPLCTTSRSSSRSSLIGGWFAPPALKKSSWSRP